MKTTSAKSGFTLVELAIVLVIIGLIVGGVLVGQDLIKAATVRAAVSQLEKYDTAVNAFRSKYNGLPGDLANATNFFTASTGGGADAQGDGDSLVEGASAAATPCGAVAPCQSGEAVVFWYQLNQAGLTPDAVGIATYDGYAANTAATVFPVSKLGKSARVAIAGIAGRNYYVVGAPGAGTPTAGVTTWTAGIATIDAFNVDTKVDDGVPNTGKAISVGTAAVANVVAGGVATAAPITSAACFDSTLNVYNTSNGATGGPDSVNCNLSVRTSF